MAIRLLVLDLDETLIYATETNLAHKPEWSFNEYVIYPRPHLNYFLQYCIANFEIGVWSSAGESYVSFITHKIFNDISMLKFIWSGKQCINKSTGIQNIKDLRKLRRFGFLTDEIIILVDSPEKVCRQSKNLLQISPFDGNLNDCELLKIIEKIESKKMTANPNSTFCPLSG
ncbi:MAG: HAD family hydrolase [Pseudomonadota bacterium]